jgi:hypothetical protein
MTMIFQKLAEVLRPRHRLGRFEFCGMCGNTVGLSVRVYREHRCQVRAFFASLSDVQKERLRSLLHSHAGSDETGRDLSFAARKWLEQQRKARGALRRRRTS